jgi:DNA-directed RNA polymerase specialized sigma24 family protein
MDRTVQDIERAIDGLTPEQREELYLWLDQNYPQPIDAQLKAGLDAGRIDDRINRALADHKDGRTQPL